MLPEGDDMGSPSDDEEDSGRGDDLPQDSGFGSIIGASPIRQA